MIEHVNKSIELNMLNHSKIDLNDLVIEESDAYHKNTIIRLIKTWNLYLDQEASRNDVLVSMRNYLLVFNTKLNIQKDINEPLFGLYNDEGTVFAARETPSYVNDTFVEDVYAGLKSIENKSIDQFNLNTNAYISELTGYQHFKSIEQKIAVMGVLGMPNGYTSLVCLPTGGEIGRAHV